MENQELTPLELKAQENEEYQNSLEEKCTRIGAKSYLSFTTENGKRIVAFIREPNYLASIKGLDLMNAGKIFEAGNTLFAACYMYDESDSECEQPKYKAAICAHISSLLDVAIPEFKKK